MQDFRIPHYLWDFWWFLSGRFCFWNISYSYSFSKKFFHWINLAALSAFYPLIDGSLQSTFGSAGSAFFGRFFIRSLFLIIFKATVLHLQQTVLSQLGIPQYLLLENPSISSHSRIHLLQSLKDSFSVSHSRHFSLAIVFSLYLLQLRLGWELGSFQQEKE